MTRKRPGSERRRDRAVSDVVAFTIVFSIIITSVGIVSAVGFTTLDDIQTDERAVNARRAMQSLGDNLGEIQRGHAPGRAGEIELSDGTLTIDPASRSSTTLGEGAVLRVSGSEISDRVFDLGSVRYLIEDKRNVTLESGAVFGADRGGAIMVEEPRITCEGDQAVVSIISMQVPPDANTTLSGGTVQIEARETSSELNYSDTGPDNEDVRIQVVDSRFTQQWIDGLERNGWDPSVGGDRTVGCSGVEQVYVRRTTLVVDILG